MKIKAAMLSTIDNPFNPFKDFNNWFLFDIEKGYNTCGLLARFVSNAESLSTIEEINDTEQAIDTIIINDPSNLYIKITEEEIIDEKESENDEN